MPQKLEDKAKNVGSNKRVRTSKSDVRAEGRPTIPSRQQLLAEKCGDILQDVGAATVRFEEKIRRLPAGGEGWETKNKKKRSVGVVGGRSINGDRDIKRAMHQKMNTESKLRLACDSQGFRSKYSPGQVAISKLDGSSEPSISDNSTALRNEMENGSVSRDRMALLESKIVTKGSNKPNVHEDALASSPNTVVKAKVSRAPRTSSIMLLDSSLKAHSSASVQGLEQPANLNKVSVPGVAESQKRQMSAGSSSHAMAQWVGQRPHKNARTRRANIVAPVSSHDEGQISSQGFSASDISVRTSVGTSRSAIASTQDDIAASKVKREVESITSTFGLSESEESGAGENKMKDKVTDNGEVTLTTSQKPGAFLLPGRKNKLTTNENGDGVRRQGRSGRDSSSSRPGFPQVREKLENLPTTKPMPSVKPASERNKSKTGRPPSKKLKDQRALSRVGPMLNGSSLDLTAESDDREELFVAAKSARNASGMHLDLFLDLPFNRTVI
uniref:Uncharacterized protein LOC105640155 isoform X4 n=2 Tax=Rhizophora mucronata TaxID=61149 RepID=A0A2P2MTC1_RHIMU